MQARIQHLGGSQLERMNKQKRESLKWALKNSYNARMIQTYLGAFPALIVSDTSSGIHSDYDKKFISVDHDAGLSCGDTFRIIDNGTHWMVYLPVLTETAYLRSQIIRCRYSLEINGETYWIYFQGPTETSIRWLQRKNTEYSAPNLSGTVYIKDTPDTREFFHRFTKIEIDGSTWQVEVVDPITVDGIIEVELGEYFNNSVKDLPKIVNAEGNESKIHGETIVKQDSINGFAIVPEAYNPKFQWKVFGNPRVKLDKVYENGRSCKVKVFPGAIKSFYVEYGDEQLRVEVDWHKPVIQGPQEVYPYDVHTYWLKGIDDGTEIQFRLDCPKGVAKFVDMGNDYCKVEFIGGKSGKMSLLAKNDDDVYELPITVKSLEGRDI